MGCEDMIKAIEGLLKEKSESLAKDLARPGMIQSSGRFDIEDELTSIEYFIDFINTNRGSLLSDCRDLQSRPKSEDSYKETLLYKSLHTPKRVELFKPTPKTIPDECAQLKEKIERMASKGHRGSIFGDARDRYRDLNCDDITGEPYTPL